MPDMIFRPSHWGKGKPSSHNMNIRRRSPPSSHQKQNRNMQQESRKAKLAAAASNTTLQSSRLMQYPTVRRLHSNSSPTLASGGATAAALNKSTSMDTASERLSPPPTVNKSFAPAFLPTHANTDTVNGQDATAVDDMDVEDTFPAFENDDNRSPYQRSPRRDSSSRNNKRPRKSMSGGAANHGKNFINWKAKLKSIQNSLMHDQTRLRSYPYPDKPSSRFDISDPRNNAKSYMDVTIMSHPVPCLPVTTHRPRKHDGRGESCTVLAFLHNYHVHATNTTTTTSSGAVDNGQPLKDCYVWMMFSNDQMIQKDQQLRIYNAVIVPYPEQTKVGGGSEYGTTISCAHMVLCTDLCEPYPTSILGPLRVVGGVDNTTMQVELT